MKRTQLKHWLLLSVFALITALEAMAWLPNITTPLERLEYASRDAFMRLRGNRATSDQIVIVALDDFTFNWTGYRWPFPRSYYAEIVNQVAKGGGKVIGLDLFLFAPDEQAENDDELAAALRAMPASVSVVQIVKNPQAQYSLATLSQPLPVYQEALSGVGVTEFMRDEDAVVRSVRAYDVYQEKTFYHWAFELARLYLGAPAPERASQNALQFDHQLVPLHQGQMILNYAGPAGSYPTYSASDVHDGVTLEQNPAAFRGKIVLIGATTVTLQDLYPTPFSAQVLTPGVEVVANAVDTILSGAYLQQPLPWVNLAWIVAAAFAALLILRSKSPLASILILAFSVAAYFGLAWFLLASKRYILPFVSPLSMLALGTLIPFTEQAVSEEIEKRRIRALFSRFISPEMVSQIVSAQDLSSLNKRANLTILFSDIRGFTTLSEKLTPEEVVNLLNPYLAAMTAIINQHGGTVDKYEGDAIVAFFGEPIPYKDHALRAARASVDMLEKVNQLSEEWLAAGRLQNRLNIGIGLNSGEVFVGLLGSKERINYTIIGDNANLAARLQDQTKTYAWPLLISESVYQQINGEFAAEFADAVTVKGKTHPVNVYKVLGKLDLSQTVQPWQSR
ncbi:MAG: adenylate/guanylate cyclase domain-containing protein [Anaerolineales bacterium]